jgi:hypothetical protein
MLTGILPPMQTEGRTARLRGTWDDSHCLLAPVRRAWTTHVVARSPTRLPPRAREQIRQEASRGVPGTPPVRGPSSARRRACEPHQADEDRTIRAPRRSSHTVCACRTPRRRMAPSPRSATIAAEVRGETDERGVIWTSGVPSAGSMSPRAPVRTDRVPLFTVLAGVLVTWRATLVRVDRVHVCSHFFRHLAHRRVANI